MSPGSPVNINAGSSAGGVGGNIYLKAGAGTSSGSIYFVNPSTESNFGVISDSTVDFSGLSTWTMSTSGTTQLSSSTTITLEATNGISLGESNIYDFETGSSTVGGDNPSGEVEMHKMAGKITSEIANLAASDTDEINFYNNRVTANSIVIFTIGEDGGCEPVVLKASPSSGKVSIRVKNFAASACTQPYTLQFMVIN